MIRTRGPLIALFLITALFSCKNFWGNPHATPLPARTVPAVPGAVRAEPANWWAGMKHNRVEVLFHYPGLASYEVRLGRTKKVRLAAVEKGDSPNYLFVTLEIDDKAPPQRVPVLFSKGERLFSYEFPVYHRNGAAKGQGLSSSDVMYLIYPDRFANGDTTNDHLLDMLDGSGRDQPTGRHGGDLQGIADHLDYLQDLGISAIWLNPELENDQARDSYHGYALTDHYRVDRRIGSNLQLRDLVTQCHRKGIKVVRDVVLNHIGDRHYWMADLPMQDWIHQWPSYTGTNYRATTVLDPYASDRDKKVFQGGWFASAMPDLNQQNPHVATYLTQQAIWWVEYAGIDAFRIDTYAYSDQDFCSRWCRALRDEYPQIFLFGEIWEEEVIPQGFFAGGQPMSRAHFDSHLSGVVDFNLCFAIREALTQQQDWMGGVSKVYYTLAQDHFYQHPYNNVVMLDNHDMTRFFTHIGSDPDKYKTGMAFMLTTRGIPQIYYGTEILMEGSKDVSDGDLRRDFPGGWPGDPVDKFVAEGRTEGEEAAFQFTRSLIRYRNQTPALQAGRLVHFIPEDGVYVYFRYDDAATVMVVLNTSDKAVSLPLSRFSERLEGFRGARNVVSGAELSGLKTLSVPANAPLVLELLR
ncbi:MAG: glycoside hydrolase family 13 protein [Saprospiraceae bacterium]|nr:glycoside hydrolase family 13 protein [Saprospiraceae bacterium]